MITFSPFSRIVLFTLISFFLTQCASYKQVSLSENEFDNNRPVKESFKDYNIYLFGDNGAYRLENPSINDSTVKGRPVLIRDSANLAQIQNPGSRKEQKRHKNDLLVFTDKPIIINDKDNASIVLNPGSSGVPYELKKEDINKVILYADDKKGKFSRTALLVIGIIVGALLLIWLTFIIAAGLNSNNNSGGSNSGGNSGSNSGGSGGSNSGNSGGGTSSSGSGSGSGGGGSNTGSGSSSSGCYIATMVYGNYDAPEVMVLRKFRDEVLSRSSGGRYFIKQYYHYSPLFVKRFHKNKAINKTAKLLLDNWIKYLSKP